MNPASRSRTVPALFNSFRMPSPTGTFLKPGGRLVEGTAGKHRASGLALVRRVRGDSKTVIVIPGNAKVRKKKGHAAVWPVPKLVASCKPAPLSQPKTNFRCAILERLRTSWHVRRTTGVDLANQFDKTLPNRQGGARGGGGGGPPLFFGKTTGPRNLGTDRRKVEGSCCAVGSGRDHWRYRALALQAQGRENRDCRSDWGALRHKLCHKG